jgi:hypothetical protein
MSVYFYSFPIISPWTGAIPFFKNKNLNPLLPRIICAKSGKNCPSGSGEKVYK